MIKTLQQAVFLRMSLFFAFGILIQTQKNFLPLWAACMGISLSFLIFIQFRKKTISYRRRWVFGMGLFLFFSSSAGIISHLKWKQAEWIEEEGIRNYQVELIDEPIKKPQTWMCKAKTRGKTVFIYLPIDSASSSLNPSDRLLIRAHFNKTDRIDDRKQGIAARAFIAKTHWEKIEPLPEHRFNIGFLSLKYRRNLLNQLKKILPDEKSYAIAAAISLGYSHEINKETRQIFSDTGSSHILSISGLHFAILYASFHFLLSFLGNKQKGRIVRQMIILPMLWLFAFFIGMPPSVIRAVIMITVWGIGNAFLFQGLTINTVGSAAFFMLLYNPYYLYDAGFQLSFCAVFSILLINPYLTSLYHSRNPMLNYVWELSCTSSSAQLGTAPLSMYYFHQFPLLYLVSNLFAIPLTGILLLLIPLSLLASYFFRNQPELMYPLQKLLELFIGLLSGLSEIPHGVIRDIHLSLKDSINMALGIVFSILSVIKKRMIYFCLLIILAALQVFYYLCSL